MNAEEFMGRLSNTFLLVSACAGLMYGAGANAYIQHNLVSDQPGVADVTDPNLVNGWDIATSATSPFWISATGTGQALVYSTAGATSHLDSRRAQGRHSTWEIKYGLDCSRVR
jgi:hypothetical protein